MSRLNELRGAASFRLALLFAGMFGAASLIFVGAVYLMTSHFLSGNPDERMRAEAAQFDARPGGQTRAVIDQHSVDDQTGRRPFGLFTADGRWLAGNLRRLPEPRPGPETFFETPVRTARENTIYRSVLHRLPNGDLVVVSRNIEELRRFRHELLEATLSALVLLIVLGIGGGMIVGLGSLRRLDKVIGAIERITQGDLTGRLPLRGTNDEVDRLVRVVNSMLDQIERLMGEVKGVCDSIAHDLRTPLTRLLAGLERANRRNLSAAERRAAIDAAIGETRTMLRTFAALLRISEIEDGARRASFGPVDLARVVEDAVEYHEPVAEAKSVGLTVEKIERDLPLAMEGDVDLLFEAVGNLIDNAIKFTPAGGSVTIQLSPGPRLMVADTGCGLPPAERGLVKLRFQRGSQGRDALGTGLGLPLVAAIARLHGLALEFLDGVPGCRVVLHPLAAPPPHSPEAPRLTSLHPDGARASHDRARTADIQAVG